MSEGVPYPKLTKLLTVTELQDIREEIFSLSEALKTVPSEYDASFQQKINRVLDITSEVEHHTRKLRNEIEDSQRAFTQSVNDRQTAFNESIGNQLTVNQEQQLGHIKRILDEKLTNGKALTFAQLLIVSLTTALVTGAAIGGIFYALALT